MVTRNATFVVMDSEMASVAVSPKHLDQLTEYMRRHQEQGMTEEMIVARALEEFFEKDRGNDSMPGVMKTLSRYKYL